MNNTLFSRCLKPTIIKNAAYPCGQCPLCRRRKMLEWILRGTHELNTSGNKAIFITLTYKPRYLPKEGVEGYVIEKKSEDDAQGNLRPKDMTLFFKRLRKYIETKGNKQKIKYIYCGEYGTLRHRPHYHAIIYGLTPTSISEETLQKIWGMGKVVLDAKIVTEYGIQYTVGYCSKKILDSYSKRENYYKRGRLPPFLRVSKGIGKEWALQHKDEFLSVGYITYKRSEAPIPRYYLKVIKRTEGIIIKWKTLIVENTINPKKYVKTDYRFVPNPNGKYTSKIYEIQRESMIKALKEAEKETNDKYYFETIRYLENKIEQHDKFLIYVHQQWNIISKLTPEEICKVANNKRFKEEKLKTEWISQAKQYDYRGTLSAEYREEEKEIAKLKVYKLMNGAFGKRQAMEISQTLQNENI